MPVGESYFIDVVYADKGSHGPGKSENWRSPGSLLMVGKIACIIRLSNCCCNFVSDQKRDKVILDYSDFYYLFCYVYIESVVYMSINDNGVGTD